MKLFINRNQRTKKSRDIEERLNRPRYAETVLSTECCAQEKNNVNSRGERVLRGMRI